MATSSIVFVLNFVFSESRRRSSPFFFLHLDAEPPLSQILLEMPTVTLLTGAVESVFFLFLRVPDRLFPRLAVESAESSWIARDRAILQGRCLKIVHFSCRKRVLLDTHEDRTEGQGGLQRLLCSWGCAAGTCWDEGHWYFPV